MKDRPMIYCVPSKFGFVWGHLDVQRTCSLPDGSMILTLLTNRQQLEIRVTPGGKFRTSIKKFPFPGTPNGSQRAKLKP